MEYQHIIYQHGKVARVTLNRPQCFNAQSWLLREEMEDAFNRAVADEEIGAIVLSGTGQHFSSGHDISTPEDVEYREAHGHARTDRLGRFNDMRAITLENTLRWRSLPKPTIAMVRGYCIYGGWIIASAMDIIFAAEDALFLPTHVQYFSVPWEIGPRKAKEVLFEHRFMTAWEAYDYGFVNRVYTEEKLEEETLAFAERVAENYLLDPFRIQMAKFSTNHMMDAMGYTAELEVSYNSYCTMMGLQVRELPPPQQGGLARTNIAKENLELTKPWLESIHKKA
ncbi:MAG: enoyl-CoA hydratase/isomerase family protein [Deltaproteobacteria bacterium]|nr:enoyl-CoA hydratase/isomerase family protein [Deltaproteobacteria bacterium]MBW2085359.1 enoyl-CoA hydratase/isomerase family protein [Deltaproteobacteria bacterium]